MSHRAYALSLIALILAAAGALTLASARLEPLSGDLTRIGRYDEAEFGWNQAQTRFHEPHFDDAPETLRHDIVVIGDSFSHNTTGSWQNYLAAKTGAHIATLPFGPGSWRTAVDGPSYRNSPPPKVFILEIVERDLKKNFGEPQTACGAASPTPRPRLVMHSIAYATERFERSLRLRFVELSAHYFAQSLWARLMRRLGRPTGEVVLVDIARPLFTSRRKDATLVYAGDFAKRDWTDADVKAIDCNLSLARDVIERGGRTIFLTMVVPDKLTAYSPNLLDRSLAGLGIIDRLDAPSVRMIPVARTVEKAIRAGVLDVYLPDDSHFGSAGYEAAARAVEAELLRRGILIGAVTAARGGKAGPRAP